MNYFTNEIGEVFALDMEINTPDGLRVISETEALALAAAPKPALDFGVVEREWRNAALEPITWLRDRHWDQQAIEVNTTLSSEQFKELLIYMQSLRDWPQSSEFPNIENRPISPAWM